LSWSARAEKLVVILLKDRFLSGLSEQKFLHSVKTDKSQYDTQTHITAGREVLRPQEKFMGELLTPSHLMVIGAIAFLLCGGKKLL
jgi:hypothetical protein